MKLAPFADRNERRLKRIARMSRRAFMGLGLAAGATSAHAGMVWLRSKNPASSPFFATATNAATLQAILDAARASPATYAGKTIAIADGDYSGGGDGVGSRFNATGILCASTLLFYGLGDKTAVLPGINWSSLDNNGNHVTASTNLIWQRVSISRAQDAATAVILQADSTNCGLISCDLSGATAFSSVDFRFKVSVSGGTGSFVDGELLHVVNTLQVPYTGSPLNTAFGNYQASGATSGVVPFAIGTASSPSPSSPPVFNTEIAKWNGKILQNADGSAWRQLANPCNASFNASGPQFPIGMLGDCTGMILDSCTAHDLKWFFNGQVQSATIQYNQLDDFYTSFWNLAGICSDTLVQWNRGQHLWATHDDGAPGGSGGHSSVFGVSTSNLGTNSNVRIYNNYLCRAYNRFDHLVSLGGGNWSAPSGVEMNDQGVSNCVGGTGGVSSTTLTITSPVYKTTAPGANTPAPSIAVGMSVRWAGSGYDETLTILSQNSQGGTSNHNGGQGTYTLSSAVSILDGTDLFITTVNSGWDIRGNLIIGVGDTLAWEFAYTKSTLFLYNTIGCDLDLPIAAGMSYHDQYTGNHVAKNITASYSQGSGVISPDLFTGSTDNICALYNQASGPASFYSLFNGKTGSGLSSDFKRLDVAAAITAFTPKTGGRLDGGNYGFSAYVDIVNRTSSYPATPTQVSSTVATGITTNHVHADGSTYSRWFTSANHNPLLEFSTGNQFTIIVQFRIDAGDNGRAAFLGAGKNTVYELFRNTDGTLTFILRSDATTSCIVARTSFTVMGADGMTTVMFTVDSAAYKIYATKGNFTDPFLQVTTFTGLAMLRDNGNNNASIGNTYTGTSQEFLGDFGAISINEALVDVSVAATLSKVIAQDNNPVDWGSDGSTLYGSAAKVAINHVAGAAGGTDANTWNATAGVNSGNMATKFIKQSGSYTNAA